MRKMLITALLVVVTEILAPIGLRAQESEHEQYVSPWRTPWTYEGAAHWSDLDPEYASCNVGREQSPIEIRNAEKADLPLLKFEFKNAPLRPVTNNRYTIRVNYHPGNGNVLLTEDKQYELVQFHFHHPSEEPIDGKRYPMEVHLMYRAGDGSVAGVTALVGSGSANSTVQKIWDHMPKTEGQQEVTGVDFSPAGLLPSEQDSSYYMYMGSLSAPPCTEGVTWFILKHPVKMSKEQIDAFAKLFPNDARPLQPLNGRVVKSSQ
jgi:carbonic anhydrase